MSITVRKITPGFAAEISGVDLREPLGRTTVDAISDAINAAGVLVFHDQHITDEQQQAFSRNFGDLETTVEAPTRFRAAARCSYGGHFEPGRAEPSLARE